VKAESLKPMDQTASARRFVLISSIASTVTSLILVPFGVWVVTQIYTLHKSVALVVKENEIQQAALDRFGIIGSVNFQRHEDLDAERIANLKLRTEANERSIKELKDLSATISALKVSVDNLVDMHRAQATSGKPTVGGLYP
jgi:hypothetical protein